MAPWEIWTYDFPIEGADPCVIFTNDRNTARRRMSSLVMSAWAMIRRPLEYGVAADGFPDRPADSPPGKRASNQSLSTNRHPPESRPSAPGEIRMSHGPRKRRTFAALNDQKEKSVGLTLTES
jgi:hypothetical protein